MIYFDNAATTYPKPEVVYKKMDNFYREYGVNAGRGSYNTANNAANMIENTRKKVVSLLNINSNKDVIFTPSATVAINLILRGIKLKQGDVVYYSPFEHNAVLRTLYKLKEELNIHLRKIPVDENNLEFDLSQLEVIFKKDDIPALVVVSHVSNVCGVIAPVEQIANLTHKYNGLILVDGAQAAGLVKLDLDKIDYYVWSGHKSLYGPFGIAGIVMDKNVFPPSPLIYGGTGKASEMREMPDEIPLKYEAGSNNIQALAGLNAAIEWIEEEGKNNIFEHDKKLTLKMIEILKEFIDINLFLPKNLKKHFNVIGASFSGYTPHEIGKILNEKFDIAVRTGLHCSPEAHQFFGTMPLGLVRFSLGYFNDEKELEMLKKSLESFLI